MSDALVAALHGTALISQILILILLGALGYAVRFSGQFKLAFLKPGSPMDLVFGRINVAFHVIAVTLLPLTDCAGSPLLAYFAATLIVGSLCTG